MTITKCLHCHKEYDDMQEGNMLYCSKECEHKHNGFLENLK